ncbi:MAG: hypothetical protein IPI82_10315 [Candidatus Microthrix sp.]|nr:DNA-formamidopyrimidine glycosylase family protein [Candidatus Microthrix sp.]MBK7322814.1 hypothetical protein [Candidatus Microthrix sp.]
MELPEYEVIRRDLEREAGGKKIVSIEVHKKKLLVDTTVAALTEGTDGVKVSNVERLGPYLVFRLATGNAMVIRLGNGAWVRKNIPEKAKSKSRKTDSSPPRPEPEPDMVISFSQGKPIRLNDPENTSEVRLLAQDDLLGLPDAGNLGMDVVATPVSWVAFGDALLRRSGKLKSIMMDQSFLVGIGPIYSDEILYTAGLRFDRNPASLSAQEVRRLYRAVVETMHDAIKYGGTAVDDPPFEDLSGKTGGYGEYLAVYRKDGLMSPRARGPVVKRRYGHGWTYYCEQTQV